MGATYIGGEGEAKIPKSFNRKCSRKNDHSIQMLPLRCIVNLEPKRQILLFCTRLHFRPFLRSMNAIMRVNENTPSKYIFNNTMWSFTSTTPLC